MGFAQRNSCPFLNYTTWLFCYFPHQLFITHALFEQIATSDKREREVLSPYPCFNIIENNRIYVHMSTMSLKHILSCLTTQQAAENLKSLTSEDLRLPRVLETASLHDWAEGRRKQGRPHCLSPWSPPPRPHYCPCGQIFAQVMLFPLPHLVRACGSSGLGACQSFWPHWPCEEKQAVFWSPWWRADSHWTCEISVCRGSAADPGHLRTHLQTWQRHGAGCTPPHPGRLQYGCLAMRRCWAWPQANRMLLNTKERSCCSDPHLVSRPVAPGWHWSRVW